MEEEYQDLSEKNTPSGPDPNAWLVTFTDLIMLLLTFFVMIFSSRSIDKLFLKDVFAPLFKYVHIEDPSGEIPIRGKKAKIILGKEMLKKELETQELLQKIKPSEDERGISITLSSDALFQSGEARVPLSGWHLLDALGVLFKNIDNDIIIMGHTDNEPVHNEKFQDNMNLSVERALSVAKYLSERTGLPASRIAAGGYGDTRPAFANDSEKNRTRNRRIEFILRKPR